MLSLFLGIQGVISLVGELEIVPVVLFVLLGETTVLVTELTFSDGQLVELFLLLVLEFTLMCEFLGKLLVVQLVTFNLLPLLNILSLLIFVLQSEIVVFLLELLHLLRLASESIRDSLLLILKLLLLF
jgi:hypothetical protein